MDERCRYVPCERCHGTGEIVISVGPHQCDTDAVLCSACDGYGMECVETDVAGIEHTELPNPFTTPLDDPRIQKMIDETASVWER